MRHIINRMPKIYRNIGILDHMGHGNLGDAATQDAVIDNLRCRCPEARILGFSQNPHDTYERHGIPSYAIRKDCKNPPASSCGTSEPEKGPPGFLERIKNITRRYPYFHKVLSKFSDLTVRRSFIQELLFLFESLRVVRSLDLLIISGGGQLNEEWGGPWLFPYTLFKWVLLARLSGVTAIFLNVGAHTITHPVSKFFIRRALSLANYRSFRDERTQRLVREIGFCGMSSVFPDSAYSLNMSRLHPPSTTRIGKPIVGLAPMPYGDPRVYPIKDREFYIFLINHLAQFAIWLIRNNYNVMLFGSDIHHDALAIADLRERIASEIPAEQLAQSIIQPEISTTEELLRQMSLTEYVVTCRFHGVIFSHLLMKPVLAIAHHPKVSILMDDLGLSAHCLEIDQVASGRLIEKFQLVVRNRNKIKSGLAEKLESYKKDLAKQYDALFSARTNGERFDQQLELQRRTVS